MPPVHPNSDDSDASIAANTLPITNEDTQLSRGEVVPPWLLTEDTMTEEDLENELPDLVVPDLLLPRAPSSPHFGNNASLHGQEDVEGTVLGIVCCYLGP